MARSFRTRNARSLLLTAAAAAFVSGSVGGKVEAAPRLVLLLEELKRQG